jgi:hypothetical protein
MKQKICHDNSTPPYDSYCSYCSRSNGCDSEDFREVPDGSPDQIHIDQIKTENDLQEHSKKIAIGFADWIADNYVSNGRKGYWDSKELNDKFAPKHLVDTTEELYSLYLTSLK